jgi:hypothetical protein
MPLSPSILARLTYQQESISTLIQGLSEAQLKYRINPDKWSSFENIVHLASYQPGFLSRLESIATQQEPGFDRYVAEKDPLFYEFLKNSLPQVLDQILADRQAIIKKLSGFSEAQLLRVGEHPKFGRMTVIQWTEFFLLHEAHHIFTLFMLTQELRKAG